MTASNLASFLCTVVVAGLLGAGAMDLSMWLMTRAGLARGSMIVALGSLLTRSRTNAFRTGVLVHGAAAVIFATGYVLLMVAVHLTALPTALVFGASVGFIHGMIVSLMLVWVVAEHHPLEEFKEADLAIGLSHLGGHVVFGAVVGLVVGVSPL